ncbi:MAG: outer membrane beta-barrel protein [Acidobacteriota bacterium]
MNRAMLATTTFTLLVVAAPAKASSIAVRLGFFSPRGESQLWEDNVQTFDLAVSDFNSVFGGVEFALELNEFVDLAVGVDGYSRTVASRYRDFVRDDGTEIEQEIRLTVAPVTVGLRVLPLGKFRSLVPYVAGGFGLYPFEYREEGEFIDFETFDIFGDVFLDPGVGVGAYAAAGLEVGVTRAVSVFGEYRRHWAGVDHGGDFDGFGEFDLDADVVGFGFNIRF